MPLKTLFLTSFISYTVNICRYQHTTCKHVGVLSWLPSALQCGYTGVRTNLHTHTNTCALWFKWWKLSSLRTRDWLHISLSSLGWLCGWQICPHNSRRCPGTSRDITHILNWENGRRVLCCLADPEHTCSYCNVLQGNLRKIMPVMKIKKHGLKIKN